MKPKLIFTYGILAAFMTFSSCSESDESPKLNFVAGGITYSFKNTKFYLTNENTSSGRTYRQYFITDGVYTNGSGNQGWSLDDYSDETFFFAIELTSAVSEPLEPGEFPLYASWGLVPDGSNFGYLYMESGPENNRVSYFPVDASTDHSPVIVNGGMDDGDKLKITFNGTITHYTSDGSNTEREEVTGKLYYEGTVIDSRPI